MFEIETDLIRIILWNLHTGITLPPPPPASRTHHHVPISTAYTILEYMRATTCLRRKGWRGRPPNFVEWVQRSPLGIMRQACVRSRKVITCVIWKFIDLSKSWRINEVVIIHEIKRLLKYRGLNASMIHWWNISYNKPLKPISYS